MKLEDTSDESSRQRIKSIKPFIYNNMVSIDLKSRKEISMVDYNIERCETIEYENEQQESSLSNSITPDRINGEEEKEMKEEIITLEYSVDRSKSDYREWEKLIEFLLQYKIPFNTTTVEDDDCCVEFITVDDEIYRYFCWYTYDDHGIFSYKEGGTVDRFIINKEGRK